MSMRRPVQVLVIIILMTTSTQPVGYSKEWHSIAFAQESLDGMIAFIRSENIWVTNADGSNEQQLTSAGGYAEPEWSPDMSKLAYIQTIRQDDKDVMQVGYIDLADLDEVILVEPEPTPFVLVGSYYRFSNPRWSPDGDSLYFLASDGRVQGDAIRKLNLRSRTQDRDLILFARSLDISPVDGRIVYQVYSHGPVLGVGLNIAMEDGSMERILIPVGEIDSIGNPRWSTSGEHILFGIYSGSSQQYSIGMVNSNSGQTYLPLSDIEGYLDGYDWSPDSIHFVYSSDGMLSIYDSSTAMEWNLTQGSQPSWGASSLPVEPFLHTDECGIWKWDGPNEEKGLRIQTSLITEASEIDCRGAFRFHNDTGAWGFGGYTLSLQSRSENTELVWVPPLARGIRTARLTPLLDIELHTTPENIASSATVSLQGDMTLSTVTFDSAIFMIRTAFTLSPPGTSCLIPEEQIFLTGMRVANILTTTTELALRGDFRGAYDEFLQIAEHFFEQSGEVMAEIGLDCAADILKGVAERPAVVTRIAIDYLTWIPIVLFDYFNYQGQPALVNLAYTPSERAQPIRIPISLTPSGITASNYDQLGSKDSAGNIVTYEPLRAIDKQSTTAWRVPGNGRDEWLELSFDGFVQVNQIGIIPGYDKIDPFDHTDRFSQNYVVKDILILFSEGETTEYSFRYDRQMQYLMVDNISTRWIRIEIEDTYSPQSTDPREFTPISEVEVIGWSH
jgi:Tol biopolymer transport system component